LCAAAREDSAAIGCFHAFPKTVHLGAATVVRLKGTFRHFSKGNYEYTPERMLLSYGGAMACHFNTSVAKVTGKAKCAPVLGGVIGLCYLSASFAVISIRIVLVAWRRARGDWNFGVC
jgi:hypothetical protein